MNRLKQIHFGHIGVLLTLLIGGVDIGLVWMRGPQFEDINSLFGLMLTAVAQQFTVVPSLIRASSDRADLLYWLFFSTYFLMTGLFATLLWLRVRQTKKKTSVRGTILLSTQLLIGLFVNSAFLFILAAELAVVLPPRKGLQLLVLQMLLYVAVVCCTMIRIFPFDKVMYVRLLYLTAELISQALVFAGAYLTLLERRHRLQLLTANAELVATQSLLGDTVRASERLRIARDLHDVLGHHLTALNLHLNLALRQTDDLRLASMHTASELASSLLAEVRSVVGTERSDQPINLRHALESLCAGIPTPNIRLIFAEHVAISSPSVAHALFCCVQECISNAVRHSGAKLLTVELSYRQEHLLVAIVDDGCGSPQIREGNGLRGMRERMEQLGGELFASNRPQRGFGLELSLPIARCSA